MRRLAILLAVMVCACTEGYAVRSARAVVGDLVPAQLAVPDDTIAVSGSTVPVAHAHPIDGERPLAMRAEPRPDRSRRFWQVVSGEALVGGVALVTTAPGATISLRPRGEARDAGGIDPGAIVLVDPEGAEHSGGAGMHTSVAWDQLRAGESPFAPGTSAFRVDPELGAGTWTVRVDAPLGDDDVLVHVVEPDSALELTARTDATTYLVGHTVVVDVEARQESAWVEVLDASAEARSPAGRRVGIDLEPTARGRLQGRLDLDELEVVAGGAWVIEVDAEIEAGTADEPIRAKRNARVAFGYGVAAAGFDGTVELVDAPRDARVLSLGMEVVASGRYAVAATVWGIDARGPHPLGIVQSAAWLDPGADSIELPMGELLDAPGLGTRFELRDVRLVDQTRVALLHRQALGVALEL